MVKNYFKPLLRSFKRKKAFTLINVGGLTLGITCSLIMFLIVKHELSYDNYHENGDRLYRITTTSTFDGNTSYRIGVPWPLPKAVKEDIVGLDDITFFKHSRFGRFTIINSSGDERFFDENPGVVHAQPSFFQMFDWEWLEGDMASALAEPNTVVLDTENAEKFFPGESPLGKVIKFNNQVDLKVTGLVKQRPKTTDFPFEIFISMATIENNQDRTQWGSTASDDRCYVMLNSGVTPESINAQFPDFVTKHFGEKSTNEIKIQSLSEVHFDEQYGNMNFRSISKSLLYVLSAVCVFMVITACFNFINMSTAMAIKRAKEVGIRKVLGSTRKQLVSSFLLETGLITLLSIVISLAITERLLPTVVNDLTDLDLTLALLSDGQLLLYLGGLIVFVTALAGLYPAWIISAFRPAQVLRGVVGNRDGSKMSLRRVLVTFQFALSQVFIFGTLIALWQMQYVRTADLGYDREWIVYLSLPPSGNEDLNFWRGEIAANSLITSHSFAQNPPFSGSSSSTNALFELEDGPHNITSFLKPADSKYFETYGLQIIAGEGLMDSETRSGYVINEAFLKKMGLEPEEALGHIISIGGQKAPISGVVKDFHTTTLKEKIRPVAIFNQPGSYRTLAVKFQAGSADEVLQGLEDSWDKVYSEHDIRYTFFDEYIGRFYAKEKKFSRMLSTFAGIAIFICCLGLYGLVSYMANQKTKEIGIRKVLGATIRSIMGSFSMEFVRLVILAFLVAAPLAYYGMEGWLSDFEYRITIGPGIFILGIVASLIITLITTGYRSFKAARSNPVDSLRSE